MKKHISLLLLLAFMSLNCGIAQSSSIINEHIKQGEKVAKEAPTSLVTKTADQAVVVQYNVIEVTYAQDFSSKTAQIGDEVNFLLNQGLKTEEDTVILPEGTKLKAEVIGIQMPKSFNRSGKVTMQFKEFITPDGQVIPVKAKLFKKDFLSRGKLNALGKGLGTTLGATAVGVGAGCGIGVAAGAVIVGGLAIGLPVGIAVGAIAGYATPGLHYKAKAGDKLLIQLTDDMAVAQ